MLCVCVCVCVRRAYSRFRFQNHWRVGIIKSLYYCRRCTPDRVNRLPNSITLYYITNIIIIIVSSYSMHAHVSAAAAGGSVVRSKIRRKKTVLKLII